MLHDKRGVPVMVHDVLKMFHFGISKKKYFMYKWVIEKNGHLYGHHLGSRGDKDAFKLCQGVLDNCEVVQGYNPYFDDREKIKNETQNLKSCGSRGRLDLTPLVESWRFE